MPRGCRHAVNGLCSAALIAALILFTSPIAADPAFEVVSVSREFDQRAGRPVLNIRLKEQRPFTRSEAEKQVLRKFELRIDGKTIIRAVIREPVYIGALRFWGFAAEDAEQIERAFKAGRKLEFTIVD